MKSQLTKHERPHMKRWPMDILNVKKGFAEPLFYIRELSTQVKDIENSFSRIHTFQGMGE